MNTPQDTLRRFGLKPKKSWGQNFLGDPDLLRRIAEASQAGPDDTVIELGAGLGHLTQALLDLGPTVVAVERDRDMIRVLRAAFAQEPRLQIAEANAATVDLAPFQVGARKLIVIGNLPYQLSSAILFAMLAQRTRIKRLVLLLQAEFIDRLAAGPGGRDYGVLSIQAQVVAEVLPLFRVPSRAFHPAPSVDSALVELVPLESPRVPAAALPLFSNVVRGAFQQRRKTLANALAGAGFQHAKEALIAAGIDPGRRAETLTLEEFGQLTERIQTAAGATV